MKKLKKLFTIAVFVLICLVGLGCEAPQTNQPIAETPRLVVDHTTDQGALVVRIDPPLAVDQEARLIVIHNQPDPTTISDWCKTGVFTLMEPAPNQLWQNQLYSCRLEIQQNSRINEFEIQLDVSKVMLPPGLRVHLPLDGSTTLGDIYIAWQYRGQPQPTWFIVTIEDSATRDVKVDWVQGGGNATIIGNLYPGARYSGSVVAVGMIDGSEKTLAQALIPRFRVKG